jgi:hypothetical protein
MVATLTPVEEVLLRAGHGHDATRAAEADVATVEGLLRRSLVKPIFDSLKN